MKSKLLVAAIAAFLFIPLIAFANGAYVAPQPAASPFDGFYLGLGAGVVHNVADANASYLGEAEAHSEIPGLITEKINGSTDKGRNTIGGTLYAGYGYTFGQNKRWYGAGDLFVRYSPDNGKYTKTSHSMTMSQGDQYMTQGHSLKYGKIKTNWFYGAQLKGGYAVCPHTIFYLSIGGEYAQFRVSGAKYSYWANSNVPGYTPYSYTLAGKSFNKWRLGIVPGVGVMASLDENWILNAHYTYAFFGSFSKTTHGIHTPEPTPIDATPAETPYTIKSKVKSMHVSQFLLSLAYKFDF